MMTFFQLLEADLVLGEGSIYERLRRHPSIEYDPQIKHAGLIYDDGFRRHLSDVHDEYIAVAREAGLPMLVTSSTYRANPRRLALSGFSDRRVNQDNVRFIRELADARRSPTAPLLVGGGMGPDGDAYRPEVGLATDEAERFHSEQADALAEGGVDVLLGMTLPAFPEALGLARAMQATGLPYVLSFVVRDSGVLLDGTSLDEAIDRIDQGAVRPPSGYLINCVHPSICDLALRASEPRTVERIIGLKANTSALRPEELDGSDELLTEEPEVLARQVAKVRREHGLTFVAGCCGTGTEHIAHLARACEGVSC